MKEWEFSAPDLEDYFRYATISSFAVSEDSQHIVLGSNIGGVFDVWGMDMPVGYPHQMSHIGQMIHDVHYDPQSRYIIVSADHDGDENTQLYLLPVTGGTLKDLRRSEGHRHILLHVSEDGNRIYYASDKENAMFMNNYRFDLESGVEETVIVGEGVPTYIAQVAPDEEHFVVLKMYSNTYMAGYYGTAGELRPMVPEPDAPHVVYGAEFSENGRVIYLTTNYQSEFSYLARYRPATGDFTRLLAVDGADLTDLQWDREHECLYITARGGVEDRLYRVNLSGAPLRLEPVAIPVSIVAGVSVTKAGVVHLMGQSETEPNNLYRLGEKGAWMPLTANRAMGISQATAVPATVVHYASYDGQTIEALWFSPPPQRRNGYTIVWPHGGPQASERRQFRSVVQYLTTLGYQFFAPNFRGSTGYGKTFTAMVEGDWGGGPRRDMIAGVQWLIREKMAEADKLFLMGGSYGGYMSLLLHGRHPEYFRAVVDLFGPSDLLTFYHSVPDTWKPVMNQFLGDPELHPEKFQEDSPIHYTQTMTQPMLVIQGGNDPRVVKSESDQLVEALRSQGRNVEYKVLPDEGHGFSKKENEIAVYRKIIDFLAQHQ